LRSRRSSVPFFCKLLRRYFLSPSFSSSSISLGVFESASILTACSLQRFIFFVNASISSVSVLSCSLISFFSRSIFYSSVSSTCSSTFSSFAPLPLAGGFFSFAFFSSSSLRLRSSSSFILWASASLRLRSSSSALSLAVSASCSFFVSFFPPLPLVAAAVSLASSFGLSN
jgi:hypothetical protein